MKGRSDNNLHHHIPKRPNCGNLRCPYVYKHTTPNILVYCMSRLPPRGNLKSRESVFNSGPDLYRGEIQAQCPPDLEGCVMALEDCCEEVSFGS